MKRPPPEHAKSVRSKAQAADLPLPALLSQALVAFTIEFDNEFERQMPHRITNRTAAAVSRRGPWLVSRVMWANCMRFVGADGVGVRELLALARTPTNLNGMQRWGYIVVGPDERTNTSGPRRADQLIRATPAGEGARTVWSPLTEAIETRWQKRFGQPQIERLRESLITIAGRTDASLPECMPILGYGLFTRPADRKGSRVRAHAGAEPSQDLPSLLARVLVAFAIEFEDEQTVSLATSANLVRVLDEKGIPVAGLPQLTGISKEAIRVAFGLLQKARLITIEAGPAGRTKVVRLTSAGQKAQSAYHQRLALIEQRWHARFGAADVAALRQSLEPLVGEAVAESSPLFLGLTPHPDGWRASVPAPRVLPHFPMVLHRGGYPDGS